MVKKLMVAIGIVALLLVAFVVANVLDPNGALGDIGTPKNLVTCDVTITNPLLKDVEIVTQSCTVGKTCLVGQALSFLGTRDEGTLKLTMADGKTDKVGYSLWESSEKSFQLTVCTGTTSGTLRTIDESGEVTDSVAVII